MSNSIQNCAFCFGVYRTGHNDENLCDPCLSKLRQLYPEVYQWLNRPLVMQQLEASTFPWLHDKLPALKTIADLHLRYGTREMFQYLPDARKGQCYLCPEPLPHLHYAQPVCPHCITTLADLKDAANLSGEQKSSEPERFTYSFRKGNVLRQ